MKRRYLGDSYDAVKRMWQEVFADWAPLYAEPRYIPEDIRAEFTALTRIPVLTGSPPRVYAVLNDPDTGIRLPERKNQSEGGSHIVLPTIRDQVRITGVRCVITFDQSSHREPGLTRSEQRNAKRQWLRGHGVSAFYYVSHAPFLFAFSGPKHMKQARDILRDAGVPDCRIEE